MLVVFSGPGFKVAYGNGDGPIPRAGETVGSSGDDPEFPKGVYVVERVSWSVGLRGGIDGAHVKLEPVAQVGS